MKNKISLPAVLELINDETKLEDSFASLSLNPLFQWAKIVVTDDIPNANNQRIPFEEFDNIVKTGIFSPIKMAKGSISDGHDEAMGNPIGTISQLTIEGNKVIALSALWKKERPEDITLLKEMYKSGNPPNVSWEMSYTESVIEDNEIEALKGVILNGLAIVASPAYAGRTPFVALSSKNKTEDKSVDELEQLKQEVEKYKNTISELNSKLQSKENEVKQKDEELLSLKEFKSAIEAKSAEDEKLIKIKEKFSEANLEKDEDYFNDNRGTLLGMEEDALDFLIQEMVSFSEKVSSSSTKTKIPKVSASTNIPDKEDLSDPRELAKILKERLAKK